MFLYFCILLLVFAETSVVLDWTFPNSTNKIAKTQNRKIDVNIQEIKILKDNANYTSMNETNLYTPKNLAKLLNVSTETLRLWSEDGKLTTVKTNGGHRRYAYESKPEASEDDTTKKRFVYARVSSAKQRGDLERQVAFLQKAYPNHKIVQDVGSGLNFKRTGLRKVLEACLNRDVSEVVVAHRDRLSRFGFDLFEFLFAKCGVTITVLNDESVQEPLDELAGDLFSIITVFTARYYGARKYNLRKENSVLPKPSSKRTFQQMPRRVKVLLQPNRELHQQKK